MTLCPGLRNPDDPEGENNENTQAYLEGNDIYSRQYSHQLSQEKPELPTRKTRKQQDNGSDTYTRTRDAVGPCTVAHAPNPSPHTYLRLEPKPVPSGTATLEKHDRTLAYGGANIAPIAPHR